MILTIISNAQQFQDKLISSLDSFSLLRPQEKTYLQTDRNVYITGQSIFFKAYVLLDEKPTILSKIVYAELVTENGQIVEKKMIKLSNGTASGSFDVKNTFPSNDYFLRCYSLWMLNFPDFIFERKIHILNTVNQVPASKYAAPNITCNIYPEGGDLVNGIKNKVAFKATRFGLQNNSFSGELIDNKNSKIDSFKSVHDGMGYFEFIPEQGKSYKILINSFGTQQEFILPAAKNEGIIISADNNSAGKVFVKVERNENNKNVYNKLIVVAQINNNIVYMGKLNMDESLDAVAIPKKDLPSGIMQITVFTEDRKPLVERLVFISNYSLNNEIIKPIATTFEKRKKNSLIVDVSAYKNLQAAVAVTNNETETFTTGTNILATLLLTNDLKGILFNPGYYFKDKEPSTLQHLDLLMMTNGWRRFKWDEIINNKFSTLKYPFERSLSVSGKVLQSNGKSVLKAAKINLIINGEDSTKIVSEAVTNESSTFIVDNIDFKKEATIYYQGTNTNNKEAIVSVSFNPPYFDLLEKGKINNQENLLSEYSFGVSNYFGNILKQKYTSDSIKGKTLETVVVKTKKRSVTDSLNTKYASDFFYDSDQTLAVNATYFDMFQYLRSAVPGILINKTDTGTQVSFSRYQGLDFFSENGGSSGVQFYLNEIAVTNDVIESLSVADVGLVKIFKGSTAIALGATNGAIAIYTKKDKSFRDWRKKGFDFIKRSGYSVSKEFSEIDYSKVNNESSFSDIRPTIYWNPNIMVKDGKANIDFYNDDNCTSFKIVVEGVDENGKILYAEKIIK